LPNSRAKKLKNAISSQDFSLKDESLIEEKRFDNKDKKKIITHRNKTLKLSKQESPPVHELVQLLLKHERAHPGVEQDIVLQKLQHEALLIEEKLLSYQVKGTVISSRIGPVVNIHEFEPASGIKVNKVFALQDDLTLALKASSVVIALQPGKSTLGIEVPAFFRETVLLRDILESPSFSTENILLPLALGKKIDGSPLVADLSAMPHLLVAGATGSGKSVCINTLLLSLMIKKTPKQLRFILVDPKMLELSNYDNIGHLLMPVVTDPTRAAGALKWAIEEMERRYALMKTYQVRNIAAFNEGLEKGEFVSSSSKQDLVSLPYIVIVIDELCDLMMTAPKDVEDSIQRLAQKARAAGIHLILATQRPSVDVITGVIKANLPCRLSFQVASRHDSRTILEEIGAERLLGKGDMLFLPPGVSKTIRAQCAYVGDKEINLVTTRLRELYPPQYEVEVMGEIERASEVLRQKNDTNYSDFSESTNGDGSGADEVSLYEKSKDLAYQYGFISTSAIQREFRIGYNRAARIMDKLVREGIVGPSEAAGKPRPVLKKHL
ncbi:MAG: hypothetical protein K2X39_10115, partial [Silvanigrellaceae bacterium]|nr:hypothetical protein [Silvanigrellaceae bacterium]